MLQCPKCKSALVKSEHSYQCEQHHCFDIAKRGYVNLVISNHKQTGDDKGMVKARTTFLEHGYYQALQTKLIELCKEFDPEVVIDAGCGQGYYTNALYEAIKKSFYGFDLSKYAVDEACKAHNAVSYGVANIFHMPIASNCADIVLSIFAPYDEEEINRVLKNGGYFIKVGPGPQHLIEMKTILYKDVYENEEATPCESFTLFRQERVEQQIIVIGKDDIHSLFQMTPYYWKSPKETSEQLLAMEALSVKIQFELQVYKKETTRE